MKSLYLSLLLILALYESSFCQLSQFYGEYYSLEKEGELFTLRENCWSQGLDLVYISSVEDNEPLMEILSFNSFHAENYSILSSFNDGDTVKMTGQLFDTEADEVELQEFAIWRISDTILALYHTNSNSTWYITLERDAFLFPLIPCEDEGTPVEEEN